MNITTKVIDIFPLHQISSLSVNNDHFCYILEDIDRPNGYKVNGWTCLPRTGVMSWYNVGIRYSPGFKREMLNIYNQPDKITVQSSGKKFVYAMFHGGNTHLNTDGCPITAYEMSPLRDVAMSYGDKNFTIQDKVVYNTAEKDLFDKISPLIKKGDDVRLFMLGLI